MRDGFSFPPHGKAGWGEPAQTFEMPTALDSTITPTLDLWDRLTQQGKQALEAQGHRVADTAELTRRVVSLERAHERDADHMTAVGLNVDNVQDEVRIVMESKQRQIDELLDRVEVLEGQLRALLKVAA